VDDEEEVEELVEVVELEVAELDVVELDVVGLDIVEPVDVVELLPDTRPK